MADVVGPYYNANDGIHGRDNRNGKYLDQVEQEEFAAAMKTLEGAGAVDNAAHRSPGNDYLTGDQARRNYNNMLTAGDDKKDYTTLDATATYTVA